MPDKAMVAAAGALAAVASAHARPAADVIARRAATRPAAASLIDIPELAGRWRVTGVGVLPGPVTAHVPNDPAYMARELIISPKRLAWAEGRAQGQATLDDVCDGAATARLPRPAAQKAAAELGPALKALAMDRPVTARNGHEVACLERGQWGPEASGGAVLFADSLNRIAFSWYDGVVLRLDRIAAPPGRR